MTQRVLIVSPHFPPVNAPDMQRIRISLPSFVQTGWAVTILTVDDPTPTAPLEPKLMGTVPAGVQIERAFCFSRRWTAWLGINNVALRSFPFLFLRGSQLLLSRRYDVIYFSTTMFIVLPLGRLWKLFHRVPYVIDLQDPWVSDFHSHPGAPRPPGGWKYWVAHWLGLKLEGWTMTGAAHIIAVSAAYIESLRHRYPRLQSTPATVLPFGSPDPDLRQMKETLKTCASILPAGGVRLAFAGALGPGMLAAVDILFAAMAEVRRAGVPVTAHFYGTSYSPVAPARPATADLAAHYHLQDAVFEQPDRLPYFDALQITLECEINLLFGSTDLAFTPSKTMALLAAGRPCFAITPVGSALALRLTGLNQSYVTFPVNCDKNDSVRAAAAHLLALITHPVAPGANPLLERYSANAIATEQMKIFTAAAAEIKF